MKRVPLVVGHVGRVDHCRVGFAVRLMTESIRQFIDLFMSKFEIRSWARLLELLLRFRLLETSREACKESAAAVYNQRPISESSARIQVN